MQNPQTPIVQEENGTTWFGMEMYDELMATIEPDLVSTAIDGLTEKYATETDEEADVRAERYNAAYEAFNKALRERKTTWDQQMHDLKRKAFQSLEKEDHDKEMTEDIKVLDDQLSAM